MKFESYDDQIDYILDIRDEICAVDNPGFMVLTGSNASGKSLLRKLVSQKFKRIEVSMDMRASTHEAGMFFRDLTWLATSHNSIHSLKMTLGKAPDEYDSYKGRMLLLDEPEVGCSRELCAGVGEYISKRWPLVKDIYCGCLLITHSSDLVEHLSLDCKFYNLDGLSKDEWLVRPAIPLDVDKFLDHASEFHSAVRARQK